MTGKEIGSKIAARREYLGWNQETLAVELNVERSTISRWEGGTRQVRASDLLRLIRVLGVNPSYFREEDSGGDLVAELVLEEARGAAYDDGATPEELDEIADYLRTKREMIRRKRGSQAI